jgi:hypothetical protein
VLAAALSAVLACLAAASPALAAEGWALRDPAGHRFNVTVFEQPFPDYPSGWRLRVNGRGDDLALDHTAALHVSDAMGQAWDLPNRSEELVPNDGTPVPAGSAQFDLDALTPRPSEAIPLEMELITSTGAVRFDLTPEQTQQLHDLGAG